MSLHDTDKSSFDRGAPSPNHNDQIINGAVRSHGTNSVNYVSDSTTTTTNTPIKVGFKRMVKSGVTQITWAGANTTTTSSIAHGLGYAPLVEASINHATFSGSISLTDVNLPLPTWINASTSGSTVGFITYMSVLVDATNIYFITFNSASGSAGSLFVTYYLYEQRIV